MPDAPEATAGTLAALDVLAQTRRSLVAVCDGLTDDQRLAVPDGLSNHVLWNLGHVVVTERLLAYGLARRPLGVPDAWVAAFRKGTRPTPGEAAVPYAEVRDAALALPDQTAADLRAGRLDSADFREYRTTPGVVLASVADAVRFNLYHEGLHLGSVLALRKLV